MPRQGRSHRPVVLLAAVVPFLAALTLPLIAAVAVVAQEEADEKAAAMEKIRGYMDAGEWKDAGKYLRIYLKKHASGDEEKAEIERLMRKAKGYEGFAKIQKEYQRTEKVRKAAEKLQDLLDDFPDVPELVDEGSEYLLGLRSHYVLVLDDFEHWRTPEEMEALSDDEKKKFQPMMGGAELVTDPEFVRQGKKAGRWKQKRGGSVSVPAGSDDWSEYAYFCVWIHNATLEPKAIQHLRVHVSAGGNSFYRALITLDFKGWKHFRYPLNGKKSPFGRHGWADWKEIESVWIEHVDYWMRPIDLVFDDVRLEKAVR